MPFQCDLYSVNEITINKCVSCQHLSCGTSSYFILFSYQIEGICSFSKYVHAHGKELYPFTHTLMDEVFNWTWCCHYALRKNLSFNKLQTTDWDLRELYLLYEYQVTIYLSFYNTGLYDKNELVVPFLPLTKTLHTKIAVDCLNE